MCKSKLIILSSAQQELDKIALVHYHLAGHASAIKITNVILAALEHLREFPLIGILHQDRILNAQGFRILIVNKYICVYRIIECSIYVYHIVHGTTNYPVLLRRIDG